MRDGSVLIGKHPQYRFFSLFLCLSSHVSIKYEESSFLQLSVIFFNPGRRFLWWGYSARNRFSSFFPFLKSSES